jgi:cytochrome b subunit of formate dehydrogenase
MSENALQTNSPWSIYKKISFRFFFLLLSLFIILNNNGAFMVLSSILQLPNLVLHDFIPWFSKHIIHYNYDFSIHTNGSGDTSYDWVLLLVMFLVSVTGCIIWSVLDRKRKSYNAAYYWLVVLVRFYLAFTLLLYGAVKVIKLQFPDPSLTRLLQPFGEASPMGLA